MNRGIEFCLLVCSLTRMKQLILALFLSFPLALWADDAEAPDPTEPPFEVGALPMASGYTIERADAPDLNFRIVDNKIRLYWIDDDGLIAEPELDAAVIRFSGSVRGRSFHRLSAVEGDAGLGSPYNLLKPHLYNVLLVVESLAGADPLTYRFRYTPSMDAVTAPASASE